MESLTLLELHLDEVSFTANAPGATADDGGRTTDATAPDDAGAAGGRVRRLLVALAVLLVLVAVARALTGDRELDDLADLDEADGRGGE